MTERMPCHITDGPQTPEDAVETYAPADDMTEDELRDELLDIAGTSLQALWENER